MPAIVTNQGVLLILSFVSLIYCKRRKQADGQVQISICFFKVKKKQPHKPIVSYTTSEWSALPALVHAVLACIFYVQSLYVYSLKNGGKKHLDIPLSALPNC